MSKGIRVQDLVPGERERFLMCERCDERSSADRNDYFMARPTYVFRCHGLMVLAVNQAAHVVVAR